MEKFLKDLRNSHKDFNQGKLEDSLGLDPFSEFTLWLKEAVDKKELEANAFSLCTVNKQKEPSSRIVYLKEIHSKKFIFYTNYFSRKGNDIVKNPFVSMLFFWPQLQRQIRIKGFCEKVSSEMSDEYFNSRPRESQLGAWASHQSEKLLDREELEGRYKEYSEKFPTTVPRPESWGGYSIDPDNFEFWQGRASRLHDRILFERDSDSWKTSRLNP
jgi:pyridoxamine 5'-phosphate oxidase